MRKPIIAGNWKMNTTVDDAISLVSQMQTGLEAVQDVESVVCPPFVSLHAIASLLERSTIGLGAQNMFWESKGAFTGEISPAMLSVMCQYVILGHSERRQYFGETDQDVNRKIKAALSHGLTPIVCVGEDLTENERNATALVVSGQIEVAFAGLTAQQIAGTVIAYEPIWAIGTGKAATADGAGMVIKDSIRGTLARLYDAALAATVRIQYGGSANAANIGEFMDHPEIDGALVGGASLKADEFVQMVRITSERKRGR